MRALFVLAFLGVCAPGLAALTPCTQPPGQFSAPPAILTWRPFLLSKKRTIEPVGLLQGSPFPTLPAAFQAVSDRRASGDRGAVLVRRYLHDFVAYAYAPEPDGQVDLFEVLVEGMPVGGDPEHPETWLIDEIGRVGRLRRDDGGYRLRHVGSLSSGRGLAEAASVGDPGLPRVVPPKEFRNAAETKFKPRETFRPGTDLAGLRRLLLWIDVQPPGRKVKAGGSRHSWSRVGEADDIYIQPEGMKCVEPAGADGTLGDGAAAPADLFRIGSGTTISELNEELWHRYEKAFVMLGGYDGQTIGGVMPTGTHGSVLSHGPLAEMLEGLDLIDGTGRPRRIERSKGPTDAAKFAALRPDWILSQDDRVFDAALVHLGAMGVVHSVVVRVRDRFYLKEIRTTLPFVKAREILDHGNIYCLLRGVVPCDPATPGAPFPDQPADSFHLELLFNPLGSDMVVTTRNEATGPDPEPTYFEGRPERNLFKFARIPSEHRRQLLATWFQEAVGIAFARVAHFVVEIIPASSQFFVNLAVGSLEDREGYLHRSYRVFNVGDGSNALPALTGTIFIPLRDDLYLQAIDVLREEARELRRKGIYQTAPVALRFIKGSRAMLAAPEDVASFELIFIGGTSWAMKMIEAYDAALCRKLGEENVRFHWGQAMPDLSKPRILKNFPRYQEWRRIRDELDPKGRFLNKFQESLLP